MSLLRGLLEVWRDGDHVWTAPQSSGGDHVDFQTDGNLVVYSGGSPVWASDTTWGLSLGRLPPRDREQR